MFHPKISISTYNQFMFEHYELYATASNIIQTVGSK